MIPARWTTRFSACGAARLARLIYDAAEDAAGDPLDATTRITSAAAVDAQLEGWLRRACRAAG